MISKNAEMHSKNEENEEFNFKDRRNQNYLTFLQVLFYIDIVISEIFLVLPVIRGKKGGGGGPEPRPG